MIYQNIKKKRGEKMSYNIIELNEYNFKEKTSKGVTLVSFCAPLCGLCKMLVPILEQVAEDLKYKAVIGKVNVDHNPELVEQFFY
jgi:thioredoxin 1